MFVDKHVGKVSVFPRNLLPLYAGKKVRKKYLVYFAGVRNVWNTKARSSECSSCLRRRAEHFSY